MSPDTVTTKAKTAALDTAGTSRTLLKTPQVLARARSYFECSTLEGVDLEDDGGSGSAGSHWEERQLVTEFMQAAPSGMKNVKSEFTLALLEDSGWFKPDYSKAELMSWGYKKGCSFVDTCGPVSTSGFCAAMQGQDKQCSFDRSGMGLCKNDGQYMDGCPITRADYMCSDFKGDTSEVGFFGDKDRNKCGGIDCSGASYSDASACFESSLYNKIHGPGSSPSAVGCYQFCCKCNTAGLMIKDPSGTWRNCTRPSQSFTDIPGYSGVLFCPDDWTVLCRATQSDQSACCESCPANTYKDSPATGCQNCPSHSSTKEAGSMSIADCICDPGYYRDSDGLCTACHVAQYKPDMSDGPCSSCPPKTTTLSTNSNSSDQCLCEAGYYPVLGSCSPCPPKTAKHVVGNQTCIACTNHSTLANNGHHDISSCLCNPGYTGSQTRCSACPQGFWKTTFGTEPCLAPFGQACIQRDYSMISGCTGTQLKVQSCFLSPENARDCIDHLGNAVDSSISRAFCFKAIEKHCLALNTAVEDGKGGCETLCSALRALSTAKSACTTDTNCQVKQAPLSSVQTSGRTLMCPKETEAAPFIGVEQSLCCNNLKQILSSNCKPVPCEALTAYIDSVQSKGGCSVSQECLDIRPRYDLSFVLTTFDHVKTKYRQCLQKSYSSSNTTGQLSCKSSEAKVTRGICVVTHLVGGLAVTRPMTLALSRLWLTLIPP